MRNFICIALLFLFSLSAVSCSLFTKEAPKRTAPGVPVSVAKAAVKDMQQVIELIGRVEPYSTVDIKSQVDGTLKIVHFQEGEFVKKGQILFTLDAAPYQEAYQQNQALVKQARSGVDQAQANHTKSIALEKEANANLEKAVATKNELQANLKKNEFLAENAFDSERRYAELLKNGYTTEEQYNNIKTNASVMRAQIEADKESLANARIAIEAAKAAEETARASSKYQLALIEDAKAKLDAALSQESIAAINLGYCYLKSPIDGRAGSLLVNPGNLIRSGNNQPLIKINQVEPVYVQCALPERHLPELEKHRTKNALTMKVTSKEDLSLAETGTVTFVDNQVDASTGTIQIKGQFSNKNHKLWPGQFVEAVINVSTIKGSVVVPAQAVQTGQEGEFVFVVRQDGTAELRHVKTGPSYKEETVIAEGVEAGETVVTVGQLRLTTGSKVEIITPETAAPKTEE